MIHFYLNSYKTPACKVICTEIVTHELLHRSSANFQVIKLYLNSCKIRLLQFFYFILFLSGGRDSQAVAYETLPSAACRTPKRVAKCGSCLSLGNPLRRSRVSDGQTCGVVKCETSLPAATVCGDRAFRTPKHAVECEFLLGTGNPLQRSRRSDIQNMWQNANLVRPGAAPSHEMRVNRQTLVQNCDFESSDASVA